MGALHLCISIFTCLVDVMGALALGRTIYVFCKETVARKVDCCLHLPLFFLTILQYIILIINLIKNPDHYTDNDHVCPSWDSVGGNVYQFIFVFMRASFIPCVLITIYMPYLALKRSESLDDSISHLDTLKCAGVIGVYSTFLGIYNCIFYGLRSSDRFCSIDPKVSLTIDILSFCIAFACGPYFWFYGLKEYFKLHELTDDERTVAFGEVMDTLRMIMEKENQILTNEEIELPDVTPSPSDINLSPSSVWSYGGCSSPGGDSPSPPPMPEPETHDSTSHRFKSITVNSEPDQPNQKRMKYVSDLEPPRANQTKPKLHRVITADSVGHVMLKKSGQAVRKSVLSTFDLEKRRKLKSMHRIHSIYIYGQLSLLDQEETESIAKERDLEHITPDIIRVVTALNKKLFRCATFLGFMFLASVIFTILELSMNGMPGILSNVSTLIWSFAPLLICNIVFEAPSLKREGIRLIPFNDKLREYICQSCFSNSPKSTLEITVVSCQEAV